MLRSFTYRHAFRDYRAVSPSPPPDPVIIPATVYTKEATVTHAKSGYKSFTGPDTWFLENLCYTSINRDTKSRVDYGPELSDEYTATDILSGPPGYSGASFALSRIIFSISPETGVESQAEIYLSGYGVLRNRTRSAYGAITHQEQYWRAIGDGSAESFNNISWQTDTERLLCTDPYSSYYYPPSGGVRLIDKDETTETISHDKKTTVRFREVKATQVSSGTGLIEYTRTDTTSYELKKEFTDDLLLSIAIAKLSSYGSESESLFMASSEMDYDADPHEIKIVGTKYRLEAEVPIMDRPVTYFFRWETEDQNGNIILNSTAVSVPAGSDTATTEEFVFNPLSTNGEWNIVQAYAIPLPTGSSVIKQTPERDSRPFKYRHQYRDYQALPKPPYLVIPVSWNLYAPAKSSMDEAFGTASGWSLGASRKTVYEEKFETPSLWSLGAPGYSYIWDETFSDSAGWGLRASGIIESSEETFANSDGWTLFSS